MEAEEEEKEADVTRGRVEDLLVRMISKHKRK